MKARDVLAHNMGTSTGDDAESLLLATTPDGEGVYIAPDGTLMRAKEHHTITAGSPEYYEGDPDDLGTCYRLLPIEGGDRA